MPPLEREVGWVGEDEVEGVVGDVLEGFEAVAVIETQVMFRVIECDVGLEEEVVVVGGEFGHFFGRFLWRAPSRARTRR
jgi:hypothetical protein